MNLEKVEACVGLPPSCIRCVYQAGSRVFGTHRDSSDWDFKVVVDGPGGRLGESIEVGDINVNIYSIKEFQKLVSDNDINVLMCLFLPREMKWKEEIPFGDEEFFRLKLPHLKKSVCAEATRTWKKAALLWNSDQYTARKCLGHAIRYLTFGLQLAREGRVTDYKAANDYSEEILNSPEKGLKQIVQRFNPIYEGLQLEFKNLFDSQMADILPTFVMGSELSLKAANKSVLPHVLFPPSTSSSSSSSFGSILATQKWISDHGLRSLARLFGIDIKRHPRHKNVISLAYDRELAPLHSSICQECCGLTLLVVDDESTNKRGDDGDGDRRDDDRSPTRLLAFPYQKMFQLETWEQRRKWEEGKTMERISICEEVKGKLAVLFWYEPAGEWLVTGSISEKKFWRVWERLGYRLPEAKGFCFMFQYWNEGGKRSRREEEIVRRAFGISSKSIEAEESKRESLLLHGIRDMVTLREFLPDALHAYCERLGWESVRVLPHDSFASIEDVATSVRRGGVDAFLSRSKGFVVVTPIQEDGVGCGDSTSSEKETRRWLARVKLTSPLYRAVMTLDAEDEDGLNRRRMIEIVRILREPEKGTRLEVSAEWEWKGFFDAVDSSFVQMCDMMQEAFDSMKDIEDQKAFAKAAAKYKFSSVLFDMKATGVHEVYKYLAVHRDTEYIDFAFKKQWPKLVFPSKLKG